MADSAKVFGVNSLHENTHIEFTSDGLILSVGLNVSEDISKILRFNQIVTGFTGKVYKGESFFVYRHYEKIKSQFISSQTIQFVQNNLIKKVQYDINIAKSMYHLSIAKSLLQ